MFIKSSKLHMTHFSEAPSSRSAYVHRVHVSSGGGDSSPLFVLDSEVFHLCRLGRLVTNICGLGRVAGYFLPASGRAQPGSGLKRENLPLRSA